MALEAVVYPQDPLSYSSSNDFPFRDLYFQQGEDQDPPDTKNNIKLGQEKRQGFASINYNRKGGDNSDDYSYNDQADLQWPRDELPYGSIVNTKNHPPALDVATGGERKKRRRTRSSKNKEEIENQRMTHIAVERNRRKQMNEYLAVLRSLMPPSYSQRGDQASIVGGAINYLKELEHQLQSMEPPVKTTATEDAGAAAGDKNNTIAASSSGPFSDFFAFPQFSSRPSSSSVAEGTAEIEVTMVESHASVKILAKKRPKQLLKLVASIQSLRLTLLHLNVTTHDCSVLYSISLKVEEGSQLNTVEDIAAVVNQILTRIEEESPFS
ncbi:Transcription factor bHLH96 [Raphanus sativus]|uniref:Transcription factor bHLH96-like isoform X2 n=1 Tax=Raphanus sativus TaxID=3726 RepID=A0A9W3CIV9_RAPSA|nr:transcription factor bHLH96-like isoform X2 [Raphanus sativus]KAJ4874920.1 Transcription factor bHLH96 [Raphanus sativus]